MCVGVRWWEKINRQSVMAAHSKKFFLAYLPRNLSWEVNDRKYQDAMAEAG